MTPKFFIGDVVEYIGTNSWTKEHIISEHKCYKGQSQVYATNKGAWIPEKDFKLVHKRTKQSLKKLYKDLKDER